MLRESNLLNEGLHSASAAVSKAMIDIKWTQRNNLLIISLLAEAQRVVDMLTRLSGKADRRMWLWEGGGWLMGLGEHRGTQFINLLPTVNQV